MLQDDCKQKRERFSIQIRKQHREEIYQRKRQPLSQQHVQNEQLNSIQNEEQCLIWLKNSQLDQLSSELLMHLELMLNQTKNVQLVTEIFNLYIRCGDINCLSHKLLNWSVHQEFIIPSLTLLKSLLCYPVYDLFQTPFFSIIESLYDSIRTSNYAMQEWFDIVQQLAIKCIAQQVGQKQMLFLLKTSSENITDIAIFYYLSRAAIPNKQAADYIIESGLLEKMITNILQYQYLVADLLDILKECLSYSIKTLDICIKCDIFNIYDYYFNCYYPSSETRYFIRLDILDQLTTFAFTKYYKQIVETELLSNIMNYDDYQIPQLTILSELFYTLASKDSNIETKPQVLDILKLIVSTQEIPRQIVDESVQTYELILRKVPHKLKQILLAKSYQIGLYQRIEHLKLNN